jgi:hypothetical protein
MTTAFRSRETEGALAPTATTCAQRGCTNVGAQLCAYRDRRGRACPAAFCPAHSVSFSGTSYCRRHAGTVQAIGELAKDPNGFPDLNDRAPSLVNWISRDLDENVRRLLGRTARSGESVIVDESVRLAHDPARKARWERAWRIVEHTGLVLKVTVHVSEENDSLVHVRVGTEMVADGVPPWIARRREGQEVEAAIDISQRQLFYRFLEENISAAVIRFRARGDRAPWGR